MQLGVPFRAVAVEVDEVEEGDPEQVARGNAARKARAAVGAAGPGDTVLGADTVVALDGRILPKPRAASRPEPGCAPSPGASTWW